MEKWLEDFPLMVLADDAEAEEEVVDNTGYVLVC